MSYWQFATYAFAALSVAFCIVAWAILLTARRLLKQRNASWLLVRHIKLELERGDLHAVHFLAAGADEAIEEVVKNEK